jgi:hypothetical protein
MLETPYPVGSAGRETIAPLDKSKNIESWNETIANFEIIAAAIP